MGNHLNAITDFTIAIEIDSQNINALINRGTGKAIIGDYDGAITDFTLALQLNKNDKEIYFLRGDAFSMKKSFKSAVNDFSAIIKMDSWNGKAFYKRGINLFYMNKKNWACKDLKHSGELGYSPAYEVINKTCKKKKGRRKRKR